MQHKHIYFYICTASSSAENDALMLFCSNTT